MTGLLYINDTYIFEEIAIIQEVWEDDFSLYIILDRTIFYPQGWWQPSDIGSIKTDWWVFEVTKCKISSEWIVYHYGENISGKTLPWEKAHIEINKEERISNAQNHSAGHLIDVAMIELWYDTTLSPTKGYHFIKGSYVEYEWEFNQDIEQFIEDMEGVLRKLIQRDIPIIAQYEWLEDLEAPNGKTPRYVYFQWYAWVWCGGTHVKNSWEIGWVSIRKVKYRKGMLRVSYELHN